MNILYAITALGVGGAENLIADVCAGLVDKHNITVVFLRDKRNYEAQLNQMGIETIFIDIEKLGFLKAVLEIRKIIKQKKIEIVHTHLPAADTSARLAALMSPRVQVFTTLHSEPWNTQDSLLLKLLIYYNKITVNRFKRSSLIAVSNIIKDMTADMEGIRRDKIQVLYNFIDVYNPKKTEEGFSFDIPTGGRYVMIVMARLRPEKGHRVLFEAIAELVYEHGMNDILLLVLGEGDEREGLELFVDELEISRHICFIGARPNVYDYLRKSELLVLPSELEGFSLTLLEAHYCKVPVLATDIPSNKEELHDGEHGVLFKKGNVQDLVQKIILIRGGAYDLGKQVEKGHAFCMSLTRDAHIKALMEIYTSRMMRQNNGRLVSQAKRTKQ